MKAGRRLSQRVIWPTWAAGMYAALIWV